MKNVRTLLVAAVLAAAAACSGDATAPDAAQRASGPRLQNAAPDTTPAPPVDRGGKTTDDPSTMETGLVGPGAG